MQYTSSARSSNPVVLSASVQSKVYGLFTIAMGLTLVGVFLGMAYAQVLLGTGTILVLTMVELGLIFTAGFWSQKHPVNYVLFGLFPLLSGITITPYLLMVLQRFENGPAILLNAVLATVFMALAAALFARIGPRLHAIGKALFIGLIGLLVLSLVQIFVPALRTQFMELLISGAGIVLFAGFTAFHLQQINEMGKLGANPFILALQLYLDIFNLFLFILRFMLALSGNRR